MSKRKRNHKAEYRRRIAKGLARGKSRSQARGHPKLGEKPHPKWRRADAEADHRLQMALRLIREGKSPTTAAKEAYVSPERIRRLVKSKRLIKRGDHWRLRKGLSRQVLIYSGGREVTIEVDEKMASRVGEYMAGVRWFVSTNKRAHLKPFAHKFVTDTNGKNYPFEVRPNVLHRLANSFGETFEQVYRVVI